MGVGEKEGPSKRRTRFIVHKYMGSAIKRILVRNYRRIKNAFRMWEEHDLQGDNSKYSFSIFKWCIVKDESQTCVVCNYYQAFCTCE